MTEKTSKKTVVKASAGKQVKDAPAKVVAQGAKVKAEPAKAAPIAEAKPKVAAKAKVSAAKLPAKAEAKSTTAPAPAAPAKASQVSADVVARKAYEIFVSEGHPHGRDQEHWFRAEAELRGASV